MASEALELIIRINLALAAAIALVLLLRAPARRWFGAQLAFLLWLIPPLAALVALSPARRVELAAPEPPPDIALVFDPAAAQVLAADAAPALPPISLLLTGLWIGGAALSLLVLLIRQRRYVRMIGPLAPRRELGQRVYRADSDKAGPAVVGVLAPVIVTPSDFDARFDADERDVVLAHERAHLARRDHLINAFSAALRCLSWFNPLVHFGDRAMRFDQELACDAAVLSVRAGARKRYAEAMLKSHGFLAAPPLGCAWPSRAFQPIKERITMLKQAMPSRTRQLIGASLVALVAVGAAAAVFALRPVEVAYADSPHPAPLLGEPGLLGSPDSFDGVNAIVDPDLDSLEIEIAELKSIMDIDIDAKFDEVDFEAMAERQAQWEERRAELAERMAELEQNRAEMMQRMAEARARMQERRQAEIQLRAEDSARISELSQDIAASASELAALVAPIAMRASEFALAHPEMSADQQRAMEAELERMSADIEARAEELAQRIEARAEEYERSAERQRQRAEQDRERADQERERVERERIERQER